MGDMGCFSFYPTKNLGCFGDGGMVTARCPKLHEKLLMLRNYGQKERYIHSIQGINSRLDEIQAAVLNVKLGCLDRWNRKRRKLAQLYNALLGDVCMTPLERKDAFDVCHLYVVRVQNRKALQAYLKNHGIETLIHYPVPVHLQEAYRGLKYRRGSFPVAENAADEILSLPMYPALSEADVRYICRKIRAFKKSEAVHGE